jgi:hypothetical protein
MTNSIRDKGASQTSGVIYTDFAPEAVARLKAANTTSSKRKPWQTAKQAEREVEVKPEPTTAVDATDLPFEVMHGFDGTNHQKGAFIRRWFPSWLAYQSKHGLSIQEMLTLTGLAYSVWYNHMNIYARRPERYGIEGQAKPVRKPKRRPKTPKTLMRKVKRMNQLADELREAGFVVELSVQIDAQAKA